MLWLHIVLGMTISCDPLLQKAYCSNFLKSDFAGSVNSQSWGIRIFIVKSKTETLIMNRLNVKVARYPIGRLSMEGHCICITHLQQ